MLEQLDLLRLTALPALLFIACLPAFLLVSARHAPVVLLLGSLAAIFVVAGPVLGTGLLLINIGGYVLVELLVRLPGRRRWGYALGFVLLQAGYWACLQLPAPPPFNTLDLTPSSATAYYILFSGVALTFLRLITYFQARAQSNAPRLTFFDYLLFMLYYPQFRHGPIERAHPFTAHLRAARKNWNIDHLRTGLARIAIGAAILGGVRIAFAVWDSYRPETRNAGIVALLAHPDTLSTAQLILLVHGPVALVYLLESSYAHIELGVSRLFGVVGSENFRHPYLARDAREVWQRWNITLFQWLRDYIYKPLRGRRPRPARRLLAIVLVFVYCGLLHTLEWRAVAWGVWTGAGVALFAWFQQRRSPNRPPPEARPALRRIVQTTLARLLTLEWFSIGVTMLIDAEHGGYYILQAYFRALGRFIGL